MSGLSRAGNDPNVSLPVADQATVREIQGEENQAIHTEVQQVVSVVSGMFNPAAEAAQQARTAAGMGKGFQFTPEQIEDQLKQCSALVEDFRHDQRDIRVIMAVKPPSPDEAGSVLHANAVRKFGQDLWKRNLSQIQFLTDWMNKLNQAKQAYMENEQLSEAQWNSLAKRLSA